MAGPIPTPFAGENRWSAAPLQISLQAMVAAPAADLFHSFSDPQLMCRLFAWMERITIESTAVPGRQQTGAVRTCLMGNGLVLQEEIVAWQPPSGYAYRGIEETHPFGMRGHVGVLVFTGAETGCRIDWRQYFTHNNAAAMRAALLPSMTTAVQTLIDRHGGRFISTEQPLHQL